MSESEETDGLVRSLFKVKDWFAIEGGGGEYSVVYDSGSRAAFRKLYERLRPLGYTPRLSGTKDDASLLLLKTDQSKTPVPRASTFLFLLSIVSILGTGAALGLIYAQDFGGSALLDAASFVLGFVVILLVRDLVQRRLSRKAGGASILNYYVPNIPVFLALPILYYLPTFGSITFLRSPAYDKDSLFDFYLWGAVAALGVTMVVALAGVPSTIVLSPASASGIPTLNPNPSLLQDLATNIMTWLKLAPSIPAGDTAVLSPISLAAWDGFLISLFALMPAALFDGGRTATLILGNRGSRITTLVVAFALVAIDSPNYWVVFLVIFLLAAIQPSNETLDSVSAISASRKALFAVALLLVLICIPVPQTFLTLPL